MSLDQALAQCPKFLTAGFVLSSNLVSVPMWLKILADQLRIIGLVGFYPTNNLILQKLIFRRIQPIIRNLIPCQKADNFCFTHTFAMYKTFNLHVLGALPALILNKDQIQNILNLFIKNQII